MALSAQWEFKQGHKKRLISCNIYPQDPNGRPIYNPFGQYKVKLFINGCWRAVSIDDFFPINSRNQLLCSFSKKGKMWTSLLEKAYLKICSGYNFCGSNTSRDLFVFTGWLPEKVKLPLTDESKIERLWDRLSGAEKTKDVLISISTGQITHEDEIGLVSGHAYAILELK